jgi:twitching motility two-component system response regulator PilG
MAARSAGVRQPLPLHGTAHGSKLAGRTAFSPFRPTAAHSGKVYALGTAFGPWHTRRPRRDVGYSLPESSRTKGRAVPDSNALSGAKVMVIDDSNTIRRSAEIFLLQAGCTVILAEDGFDALAKIADHQPDLVFVDIMMPRLDGYQTCALVKKNARYRHTPVIMLSSKDGLFDRARGRMVGSDQYLTKPFTKESLLKAVAAHVKAAA